MFTRFSGPQRSPLEEANEFVRQALEVASLYEGRYLTEVELALLKQLRLALLCGGRRVQALEETGRRGTW